MRNPITWVTRELRTRKALGFIPPKDTHVDIGCAPEQYLLKKSPCRNKIGFDKQLNQLLDDKIPLENDSVDCISMLAVIEHLDYPRQIIRECNRVLKDDGVLIITTPKGKGLWIMRLYAPRFEDIEGDHKQHFDYEQMSILLKDYFSIKIYREFEIGFNQLFVCEKVKEAKDISVSIP